MAAPSISLVRTSAFKCSAPLFSERVAAGLVLTVISPALAIVLGTVRVLSGRAPLVGHLRVGQFGEPLWVFKVRTMWGGVEQHGNLEGPRSNLFTLGRTATPPPGVPVALGTDSPLTAEGDFLDELRGYNSNYGDVARILRLPPNDDFIAARAFAQPPELVVVANRIHLIAPRLAEALPTALRAEFFPLQIETRPPVLVRWDIPELIAATHLTDIRLAGRKVMQ